MDLDVPEKGNDPMHRRADVVAYNPDGQIALLVEVKSRTGTSRSWATRLWQNLLAHGIAPNAPYVLVALPDRFYLWKNAGNTPALVEPTYELAAQPFLAPYYEKARVAPGDLSHESFELIVASWLNELASLGISPNVPEDQQKLLLESGLPDALRGGSVALEAPA